MRRLRQKGLVLFSTLFVMLLSGWLYWPTLQLPLIYDTLLHIRITGGLTLGSVWLPTEAFGFYRPMTFFPMLIMQRLFEGYPAWLLHGNNVVQHAANAGLLAWLSWRLWPDWRRAVAAGAIFAVFPFSYQAVTVYGHNVHPAIVGLVLLGLHSYLTAVSSQEQKGTQSYTEKARRNTEKNRNYSGLPGASYKIRLSFLRRQESTLVKKMDTRLRGYDTRIVTKNLWWLLTAGLFVMMLLTHETAVLFGGLALLVQLNAQPYLLKQPRVLLRQPWAWFLLAGLAYLVIYQFLPISRAPQVEAVGNSLWLNGLYLLQAAVFPMAWFAHLLPNVSGATLVLVSSGLVVATSGWLAWRKPAWRRPLLLAWGWWAAASVLIGVTLSTEYLLRGPRLLYLGGVGVALLWAQLLAGVWPTLSPARFLEGEGAKHLPGRGLAWTAVLGFILITSGQFVQTKLTQYEQLTEPLRVWQNNEPVLGDAEVVFVNLPQWLDVPPPTYAVGVEFVSMLGDYLFVEELANANGVGSASVWAVEVPELLGHPAYAYGVHAQHSWPPLTGNARFLMVTHYEAEKPQTHLAGGLLPPATTAAFRPEAYFDLYTLAEATARVCDGLVKASLSWRPRSATLPDTTSVFVQVLAADGRLLAQADGPPLGIRPGLLGAPPEWRMLDLREIALAEGETAVPTTLLVGVYDFASGRRSPATDAGGQPLPDNAWRIPIATCP